jgi:predicted Rossmann fold flavoprotein
MAAIQAARGGAAVTLLEQNRKPGRKLLVTGNGKCNLTNTEAEDDSFRGSHPEFAEKVLREFSVQDTISFFLGIGIYTVNRDGWVYPYNEQSASVLKSLLGEAERLRVKVKNSEKVRGIRKDGSVFRVRTDGWEYESERVILCCGSSASEVEGSDGSGYALAESLGHTVVPVVPALTYLVCLLQKEAVWNGVRVTAEAALFTDGKEACRRRGQLQLTDTGISGIPAFQLSRYASRALAEGKSCEIRIHFMPDFTREGLTAFLGAMKEKTPGRTLEECTDGLFQEKLSAVFRPFCRDESTLAQAVSDYRLPVTGTGPLSRSQAASGGVDTSEVSPETMESHLVKGLHFGGELLDVDGDCGGYNLQWAWSTGALAGRAAAEGEKI